MARFLHGANATGSLTLTQTQARIPIQVAKFVDGSTETTGDEIIPNTQDFHVTRVWWETEAGWNGPVKIQGSFDEEKWVDLSSDVATAGVHMAELDRPFFKMRLHWTGNDEVKEITAWAEQFYNRPSQTVGA